jgi:hypothetical protein
MRQCVIQRVGVEKLGSKTRFSSGEFLPIRVFLFGSGCLRACHRWFAMTKLPSTDICPPSTRPEGDALFHGVLKQLLKQIRLLKAVLGERRVMGDPI